LVVHDEGVVNDEHTRVRFDLRLEVHTILVLNLGHFRRFRYLRELLIFFA